MLFAIATFVDTAPKAQFDPIMLICMIPVVVVMIGCAFAGLSKVAKG